MKIKRAAFNYTFFSVAIAATAYAFALSHGNFALLAFFQGIVLLTPASSLLTPYHKSFETKNLLRWFSISLMVLLSVLVNVGNYSSVSTSIGFAVAHAIGIVGVLFALQWAATNFAPEKLVRQLAILLGPLIALAVAVALHDGGWLMRASPFGLHPNWWGELGFAATISALAVRNARIRAGLIGLSLVLFFLVQSRGALLAACVSVSTYLALSIRRNKLTRTHLVAGLFLLALVIVGYLLAHRAALSAWAFLKDDVLLLNNPYRGLDTGLTGRLAGWRAAMEVITDNPIFGRGLDTLDNVHNGFLQLMGEGGIALFLVIFVIVGIAVYEASSRRNRLALSIIFGYMAYAMTYPRMLNMNVASILFYLSLYSWRKTSGPLKTDRNDGNPRLITAASS